LILSIVAHGVKFSRKWLLLLVQAMVLSGIIFNLRRMAWVQIALALMVLYFIMPMTPVKRRLRRTLLYLSPLIVGYIAIGWSSTAGVFGPVHSIRTALEPGTDPSALTREIENYDLIVTLTQHP